MFKILLIINIRNHQLNDPWLLKTHPNPHLSNGQRNPLFKHRNDGYIFIHSDDYTKLELLIFPFKKNQINSIYNYIIDGYFDEQLEYMQGASKVFYEYIPKDA